ncbi:TldD/PmbA family protein [Bdellovibrio sp. HCB337]|uniref:TldD/PmbA family protein n=1 Tax=Bdellovibrio sp. HCB337 TaxID=3394358 RepID=UPI0039A5291C
MNSREILNFVAQGLFKDLHNDEALTVYFRGEDTDFIRWNQSKVRQNTSVNQKELSFELQKAGRKLKKSFSAQGSAEWDLIEAQRLLKEAREEAVALPQDPYLVPFANNGTSESIFRGELLTGEKLIQAIAKPMAAHDMAGLYAGGTIETGNCNSLGQSHWFTNESFFMDYSLYNGERASKACYAGSRWHQSEFETNIAQAAEQLAAMDKPRMKLSPGNYRVYLAPGAVAELASMFSWGALSYRAYRDGGSALKKLHDKERKFSSQFSLSENFHLGLTPRFNDMGELAPEILPLIKDGELQQFLVSSRSAKEYGVPGNHASAGEYPRAMEIAPGSLARKDILTKLDTGLYLSNLHYLNWSDQPNARITGMTRYACLWVENGKIVAPIEDMRFDVSLYDILDEGLLEVTDFREVDPSVDTYHQRSLGGKNLPGLLIKNFSFTL